MHWRINKTIFSMVKYFRKFDPEDNILIFSDPRGGSTWMAEVLNQLPRTAVLWEPLHLRYFDHFSKAGLTWEQFIPEEATWKEAEKAFHELLSGKVLNSWLCNNTPPYEFLFAKRFIVKFCRANAMIPWLTRLFSCKYKPVYLVRHPLAVVASQLKHGAWNKDFQGFVIPNCRYNDVYIRHADFLSSLETKAEALVAMWCMMNSVPLGNARNNKDWITVYYENLIVDPEKELRRIFEIWNLRIPENVLQQVRVPSHTTQDATFLNSIDKQLSKWRSFFSEKQIKRFDVILRYFGVKCYSVEDVSCVSQ